MNVHSPGKPVIALAMGDPAGISPELTAKLTCLDEIRSRARLIVIGDRRVFDEGARVAGVTADLPDVAPSADPRAVGSDAAFMDIGHLDPATIERGVASQAGGAFALENYRRALTLARDGQADAVCFTPFNKKAMRLARAEYDDEIAFSAEIAGRQASATAALNST